MSTIPLTQGKVALVDPDDYEAVAQFNWYADRNGNTWYAATRIAGQKVYLHRFVLQAKAKHIVDHADNNGLNCTKVNLRIVTKGENTIRRGPMGTSGFKGVSYDKSRNKWSAKHCDDVRGTVNLGRYKTPEEAARAYDAWASANLGPLAYLNFSS